MAVSKESGAAAVVKKAAAKPKAQKSAAEQAAERTDELTPATQADASGALVEPEIVDRIDVDHPAVDNNPRKGASVASNQIDFNDPTATPEEAVLENLGAEDKGEEDGAEKPKSD